MSHVHRVSGGLLMVSGAYLTYYWLRVRLGPSATLASDPLVGAVTRFSARIEVYAREGGVLVVVLAALIVVAGMVASRWRATRGAVRER